MSEKFRLQIDFDLCCNCGNCDALKGTNRDGKEELVKDIIEEKGSFLISAEHLFQKPEINLALDRCYLGALSIEKVEEKT